MARVRRFLRRVLTLFRSAGPSPSWRARVGAHLRLLEDEFAAKGMSAARRALRGEARLRRRRTGEGTAARRACVPPAGRLADGLKLGARMLDQDARSHRRCRRRARGGDRRRRRVARIRHTTCSARRCRVPNGESHRRHREPADAAKARTKPRAARLHHLARQTPTSIDLLARHASLSSGNLITGDGRSDASRGVEISASAFSSSCAPPGARPRPQRRRRAAWRAAGGGHRLRPVARALQRRSDVIGRIVQLGIAAT